MNPYVVKLDLIPELIRLGVLVDGSRDQFPTASKMTHKIDTCHYIAQRSEAIRYGMVGFAQYQDKAY